MKFEHLKMKVLPGRFKYVLLNTHDELVSVLKSTKSGAPCAVFQSSEEFSAIVPQEVALKSLKEQIGWAAISIVGDMPFGTVQGLIANVSNALAAKNLGICVVSTFLTDWFFVREDNLLKVVDTLKAQGWKFVE